MSIERLISAGNRLTTLILCLVNDRDVAAALVPQQIDHLLDANTAWRIARLEAQQPQQPAQPPAPTTLTQPCRKCEGTRKSCTMNCGMPLGDKRTRADVLRECDDCDSCSCRWNRIGALQSAVIRATEKLPLGYRLSIEIVRDSGTVSITNPLGECRVIEGEGYFSVDVTEAVDRAIEAETPRASW